MADGSSRAAMVAGALIALVVQLLVAPNIALAAAVPNFILSYVLVVALVCSRSCGYVTPFVMGLLFDLIGGGPVGAMALLLVVATFVLSRLATALDNGTLFMPIVMLLAGTLVVELLYAALVVACGQPVGMLEAFVYRSLPCALYDCVIGLVMYPIALRFLVARESTLPPSSLAS